MRRVNDRSLENAAVFYLQRFPSSSANLRRVLSRKVMRARAKGVEVDEAEAARLIDAVVQRMIDAGLLDDAAYAKALAQSLFRRGTPLRGIARKLREKGVPDEAANAALARLSEDHDEPDRDAAFAFARRRRLGCYRPADQRKERRERDLAALARAGFSYGLARAVVDADDSP